MTLSTELLKKLKGDIHYTVPRGHHRSSGRVKVFEGKRHENYKEANRFFIENNFPHRMDSFEKILVVVRNPYTYIISRYNYLNLNKPWDNGRVAILARNSSFEDFVMNMPFNYKFEDYINSEEGSQPSNLEIVKYENLNDEINNALKEYISKPISFKTRLNESKPAILSEYINNKSIENKIYERFSFVFDNGLYKRLEF